MELTPIELHPGSPPRTPVFGWSVWGDPKNARRAVAARNVAVLGIFGSSSKPKICPSVVKRVAINVVNFCRRPSLGHPKPRESMSGVAGPIKPNRPVPTNHFASSLAAYCAFATLYLVSKNASVRAVIKQLNKSGVTDKFFGHRLAPVSSF